MVKKLLFSISFLICIATLNCVGQATSLLIESGSSTVSIVPVMKLIGPFPKNAESYYNIDVDNNGMIDCRITTEGYDSGNNKKDYTITFESFDNSTFAIDTTIGHSEHPDSSLTPVHMDFPAPIVKMYNEHNVIYANACTQSTRFLMSSYSYVRYDGVHPSIQEVKSWISGTHYIGIKKMINNKTYLGWIKLEVRNQQEVYVDSYTRVNPEEGITMLTNVEIIYPNPTLSTITIANSAINKVEMYNALGSLVLTIEDRDETKPFIVDLTTLNNGVYLTKLFSKTSDKVITIKVVKQ